ncbi:hypothetical protein K490DRAFT_71223 [Saccharata proteae CBS 121410]|uniref:Polarized growth protein Boi2 n=1 Tax=Saccharata proteae CBS 121410 TaxID=1314787 RepID=A0A9P4I1A4_9PEZI|nr:hypothetical protein K490DRAFT_71223 [Saccharata proteae CBS 121410]
MSSRRQMDQARPGDTLLVIHEFKARSPDELSLARGDRIDLIERDDDFGDGWFLGRHLQNGHTGLFPEVYTTLAPRPTFTSSLHARPIVQYSPEAPAPKTNGKSANSSEQPIPTLSSSQLNPLHTFINDSPAQRSSSAPNRGASMGIGGGQGSPVMNETLSVIDEHLTDIHTPRHSIIAADRRMVNDSGSEYSSSQIDNRLSYINGQETDEEEQALHSRAEVSSWSPSRVAEFLEDSGVEERHCEVFQEQEISGEVLLGMDQSTVMMKELNLGPIGPRLRIWQKIKALQEEVGEVARNSMGLSELSRSASNAGERASRHRSASIGGVLPRIPSLMEEKRPMSRQQTKRTSSQQHMSRPPDPTFAPVVPPSPGLDHARRPSAASVRSLGHSRRHSSVDFATGATTPASVTPANVPTGTPKSHKKQGSFDHMWTLGADTKPSANGRPASSNNPSGDENPREVGLSVVTPNDLDRGYFSGGEVDNRKQRNVLRKSHSPTHSHTSSFADGRRMSAFRNHIRLGSSGSSVQENNEPTLNASKAYAQATRSKSARTASGPEFWKTNRMSKDRPQTVTKLDHNDHPSIDAIASSPNLGGSDTSSNEGASPPPPVQRFPKQRSTGLRAISDALAGPVLALGGASRAPASPIKDSPMNSPVRTGSSTPSGTSKSFDSGEVPPLPKSKTDPSTASSSGTTRRKTKQKTSAYQKGLLNKTPQEQMSECDYSGWMKKRSSNLMTTWKTRLFVLRGRRLSYYYAEDDTAEKGLIDISGHRVLPANNERITGIHATVTGAKSSPTSPQNTSLATSASTDAAESNALDGKDSASGMFIFKLVPPRTGLSKAVNFTKPTVHYFAVDNIQQGRLWMAALMKATIDRDETKAVTSTYQQKTISLAKARAMQQRPPNLMGPDDEEKINEEDEHGLAIAGLEDTKSEETDLLTRTSSDATTGAAPSSMTDTTAPSEAGSK